MKISYKLFNKVKSFVPSSLSCKQILSRHATTQNMACVIVLYPFIVVHFKFSLSDKLHNGRYYVSCVVSLHKNVNIYTFILDSVFEQEQLKCDFNKWSHNMKENYLNVICLNCEPLSLSRSICMDMDLHVVGISFQIKLGMAGYFALGFF